MCVPAGDGSCGAPVPAPNGTPCTANNGDAAGACMAGTCVPTAPPPPTTADVQAILNTSCIGCHGATNPRAGLSWINVRTVVDAGITDDTLFGECIDAPPVRIIAPGNPDGSYMILKITPGIVTCAGQPCLSTPPCRTGSQMPLGVPAGLPAAQIETIRRWIAAGAP
jgi:hypothetical protein